MVFSGKVWGLTIQVLEFEGLTQCVEVLRDEGLIGSFNRGEGSLNASWRVPLGFRVYGGAPSLDVESPPSPH